LQYASSTSSPGEEGSIKVEFNTRKRNGHQSKKIYVHSNDPETPTAKLAIECFVTRVASFKPGSRHFANITRGETPTLNFTLEPIDGPFRITGVKANGDFFEVIFPEDGYEVGPDNAPIEIEVRLLPEAPLGRHSGTLVLTTDHPKLAQLSAKIRADIKGLVSYTPKMLFFNRDDLSQHRKKVISIKKSGEPNLVVNRPEITVNGLDIALKELQKGVEYSITITAVGEPRTGRQQGSVIFRTNQADQDVVKIPVRTYFPGPGKKTP